ncbi:hypothetical protein MLD63_12395 [Paracoccus sp. TK19116]|uniref:D-galactarate dehydratase n=1 Tax=Paracoccus albicereus TaxID=2922394 RepID=A0ABT1MWI1_9RHOB|nr:hypothetical protein [Paracoccus albicereus]MCQ0971221.1 hypothetical protein [Paracoccus albicereus]
MNANRLVPILAASLALGACSQMMQQGTSAARNGAPLGTTAPEVTEDTPEAIRAAAAVTRAPAPRPSARATAAQLDTTTAEQRQAAATPATAAETRLGTTVASLGDATQPGFWIKTPLVNEAGVGRIVNPANGRSAQVDLLPLGGAASAGSQVSLPALQLLGISLTDLPTIEVYRL